MVGMRIHDAGDPGAPSLVLVHGLASSHRGWDRNLPGLARRHRVRIVELLPAGDWRRPFGLSAAATTLAELLADERQPVAIVGHSMGGLVVVELARRAPGLVSRLVLVDVPAVPLRRHPLRRAADVIGSGRRTDLASVGIVAAAAWRAGPLRLLAATRETLRADVGADLAGVTQPTLVVWGADDRVVPLQVGHAMVAALPHGQLALIPEAGHQPMWEQPEAFNAVVEEFLATPP
jgi:pimeloyl-ACP methyl ester carboxylesterase